MLLLKDWCVLRVTNIVFAPLQVLSVWAFIQYCGSLPGFIKNLFYIRNVCVTTLSSVCAMSTSVSLQSLETGLIWSLQNKLEFTERSPLWLCRSNVHLGIYKIANPVDSSGTALLFPSKHTESSFPTSPSRHTSFQEHFIGMTMDKVSIKMFSDGNPPVYLSLSHSSLSLSPLLSHQSLWEQWGLLILAYPPQQQVLASFACEYLIKLSRTTKNLITPALNV